MASCPEKDEVSFLSVYFLLFLQKHDSVLNYSVLFQVFMTYWVKKNYCKHTQKKTWCQKTEYLQ